MIDTAKSRISLVGDEKNPYVLISRIDQITPFSAIKETIRTHPEVPPLPLGDIRIQRPVKMALVRYAPKTAWDIPGYLNKRGFVAAPAIEVVNLVFENLKILSELQKLNPGTITRIISHERFWVKDQKKVVGLALLPNNHQTTPNVFVVNIDPEPYYYFEEGLTYVLGYLKKNIKTV